MTREEKIIATAFTGKMFIDGSDMGLLYEYMEKKVGHGVIDIMLADKAFWEELHRACEQDFIDMVSKEQPSLPSNIDEAAEEYGKNNYLAPDFMAENLAGEYDSEIDEYKSCTADAFKAGAKWQKEQGVKATASIGYYGQCGLSILTEPSIKKLGFKEGDEVEIILRKK